MERRLSFIRKMRLVTIGLAITFIFIVNAIWIPSIKRIFLPHEDGQMPLPEGRALSNLVVFGDSYSDQYNNYNALNDLEGYVSPPVGRNSGGRNWVDYLNETLRNTNIINLAYGGATVDVVCTTYHWTLLSLLINTYQPFFLFWKKNLIPTYAPDKLPGVKQEVDQFFSRYRDPGSGRLLLDNSKTLYVVWIGHNDMIRTYPVVPWGRKVTVDEISDSLFASLGRLYSAGARHFMLLDTAPMDRTPEYSRNDQVEALRARTKQLNQAWAKKFSSFVLSHPLVLSAEIFPAYDLVEQAATNATFRAILGIKEVSQPCCKGYSDLPPCPVTPCARPLEYLYWNGMHPGARFHHILSSALKSEWAYRGWQF
ncbi:uncharacterized protein VTP21DRAFT_6102 [Calcarisporiella thermophila]|uniref:uncharacterized protein n=1 Tax=Calcarisporiella thermophila TaxID=911321 RepID=UPI00374272B1